jgi:lipopolysaccharide export LptBFGC system permease protein LptF
MVAGGHTLRENGRRALIRAARSRFMNKKTLLYLSIGAIVLFVLAIILGFVNAAIGGILYLLGGIVTFLAWVMGLLFTARAKEWLWFVIVLILFAVGTLLYSLMGKKQMA